LQIIKQSLGSIPATTMAKNEMATTKALTMTRLNILR